MVSRKFVEAVRLAPKRAYRIAQEAGIHPTTLSKILNGIEKVRANDPRVLGVASVLGLNEKECFEGEDEERKGRTGDE